VFYENSFIPDQASTIIFAGARDIEGTQLVGARAAATWEDAWDMATKVVGKGPSVMVTPKVGFRTPVALEGQRLGPSVPVSGGGEHFASALHDVEHVRAEVAEFLAQFFAQGAGAFEQPGGPRRRRG
jgi:hypothetical protein